MGPTFFLIMINTLAETDLESRISMFADDTRVAKGIKSYEDVARLQHDLDKVFEWQQAKNMDFNKDKFELVSHGRNFRSNRNLPNGQYQTDDGSIINVKPAVRDLGIEISASSDFLLHISTTCKRAREKISWIFRSFYSRDIKFLSFQWRTFVQPLLDYGCQLWAPSLFSSFEKPLA